MILILLSGCSTLQTPEETNIAVSALLVEIQIAINEINAEAEANSSLPPFKNAEVKLTTKAKITTEGKASLYLSGEKSKAATNSNIITLELVPNADTTKPLVETTGRRIARYVIAAVKAADENQFLKLKSLTVEAGIEVIETVGGGIEVDLIGISLEAGRAVDETNSNSLKLVFAHPEGE